MQEMCHVSVQCAADVFCKFRAFMKTQPLFALFLTLVLALCAGPAARAEKADRSKPMAIEADNLRYDDVSQLSIFTGRVVLTKGTIVIRGARLEVSQDADGYQFGRVTGTVDQPAFFRQKRDSLEEFIEGEGETIYYDGRADTVTFTNKAQLRRYRGTTLADTISGAVIVYENLTDIFRVDGGTSTAGSGRVHAVLTPKPDEAAAAAPQGAASGAGAGGLK